MTGLTWPVVLAVLAGALLHAGWNALVKSAADKALDTALVTVTGGLVALAALPLAGLPARESWPFLAVSATIHIGYYTALAGAYRHGELGLAYPVMRGCAPLLVALSGLLLSADAAGATAGTAWLGIAGITAGVLLVGLALPARLADPQAQAEAQRRRRTALAYALANAAIIAAYTVVDGFGVRTEAAHGGHALRYVLMLYVLDGLPYALLLAWQRGPSGRRLMLAHAARRWPQATLGGAASIGSYAIALWAMTRAPVASVAALRETSVLFAALLGTVLLKEPFGPRRAAGTGLIVAGVMALRLG